MMIGHTANASGHRQSLEAHLAGVADLARLFASSLGAGDAGYWLGLWHDIGKFHPRFQAYLERCEADPRYREYVDHKAAGALLASQHLGRLAMLVQAHHGGLRNPVEYGSWLQERQVTGEPDIGLSVARAAMAALEPASPVALPRRIAAATRGLDVEMFLRMMFSALVDADSLDTERHYHPDRAETRVRPPSIDELWRRFEIDQTAKMADAPATDLSRTRRDVYEASIAAAEAAKGFFRMAVPTGGGKTRSALGFALRHAALHGLERVIVAVPYLTITDQTAAEYRKILDPDDAGTVVLEHHSQSRQIVGPERQEDDDGMDDVATWARLAAEDWDAPVVVTTTVQLFESLFASNRSDCRKLHRLARSVIILDEAQALPSRLLHPIVDGLTDLVSNFGTTVVISTATQPAFDVIPEFARIEARDIVPDVSPLYRSLRRVRYHLRLEDPMSWEKVADEMRHTNQTMVIVNTKPDAHALLAALDDVDALHLSTTLCAAHRRAVLRQVRDRLAAGSPCRVVATQVVEAGVDIDFPMVMRALGPLDSIIQAAGRCNREGRLPEGTVIVFEPSDGRLPAGAYRIATERTRTALARGIDLDDPAAIEDYFRALLTPPFTDTDAEGIQSLRERLQFPEVAARFQMIKDETESVMVHYAGDEMTVDDLIGDIRHRRDHLRHLWRRAQPYLVSLRKRDAARYRAEGIITELMPGLGEWHGTYDPVLGLRDGLGPESLIA